MTQSRGEVVGRVRRTVLNWRWWLCLPILLLVFMPIELFQLATRGIAACLNVVDDTIEWAIRPPMRALRDFAFAKAEAKARKSMGVG